MNPSLHTLVSPRTIHIEPLSYFQAHTTNPTILDWFSSLGWGNWLLMLNPSSQVASSMLYPFNWMSNWITDSPPSMMHLLARLFQVQVAKHCHYPTLRVASPPHWYILSGPLVVSHEIPLSSPESSVRKLKTTQIHPHTKEYLSWLEEPSLDGFPFNPSMIDSNLFSLYTSTLRSWFAFVKPVSQKLGPIQMDHSLSKFNTNSPSCQGGSLSIEINFNRHQPIGFLSSISN